VLASRHTKQFLAISGGTFVVLLSLFVELLGITQCAYVIRGAVERICPCNQSSAATLTGTAITTATNEPSSTDALNISGLTNEDAEPTSPLVCGSAVGVTLLPREYYDHVEYIGGATNTYFPVSRQTDASPS
jgi:hypothetical protein